MGKGVLPHEKSSCFRGYFGMAQVQGGEAFAGFLDEVFPLNHHELVIRNSGTFFKNTLILYKIHISKFCINSLKALNYYYG